MPPLPLIAALRTALDQPVFPGKIVVWLLFMLSIVAWVMILSKLINLRKGKLADRRFTERLRKSKTTLEAFEEGWDDARSLKSLIYHTGARETAWHLLGSRTPQEGFAQRLRQAGKLGARQLEFVKSAFASGCAASVASLRGGIEGLRLIGVAALFLGGFGFVWTMMQGFDQSAEFAELMTFISGSLAFFAIGLMVAAPAVLARIFLEAYVRTRALELERFRDDILRLFERSFAAPLDGPTRSASANAPGPGTPEAPEGTKQKDPSAPSDTPRRFHSIRERLLRSESETAEDLSEHFDVNPIARQAAAAAGRLGKKS